MGWLILARHGSTRENQPPEAFRGWQDLPLDQKGKLDARELAVQLQDLPIGVIWASDLKRAVETADMIGRANTGHPPVHPTRSLRPWDVGKFAGQTVTSAKPKLQRYTENPTVPVPDGESVETFSKRFLPFLQRLMVQARRAEEHVLAVTHTRNIRLALETLKHPTDVDAKALLAKDDPVGPGDFVVLQPTGRTWRVTPSTSLTRTIPGGRNALTG